MNFDFSRYVTSQSRQRFSRLLFRSLVLISLFFCLFVTCPNEASSAQATLAWDPSSDAAVTGYKIYWRTDNPEYALLADVGNSLSETVADLQPGITYYFVATAYDGDGNESDYSNEVFHTPAADCTYAITPANATVAASAGTGAITVDTQGTCTWSVANSASWVTLTSGSSGTGDGEVRYSVSPNTGPAPRTASLTVAGQIFTITQNGLVTYSLSATTSGTGSGTVTASPAGTSFSAGTVVTLTATPSATSTFMGWSGACSGTSTTCQVTMDSNKSVVAGFQATGYTLTLTKSGTGSGTLTTKPSGTVFKAGTIVAITARPSSNSVFTGWSGACSGTRSTCRVAIKGDTEVTANFALKTYTVSASKSTGGTLSTLDVTSVAAGSTQTLSLLPSDGYTLHRLRVNGKVRTTSGGAYTFSKILANQRIDARFRKR